MASPAVERLPDLIDQIRQYNPQADFDLLRKAYVYSSKVHKGQVRKSGEPYFSHPFEVASILVELKQDVPAIATGFLHDTVEDTLVTLQDIEGLFGKEVAYLVDGVTKISKITFSSKTEHQAENFRKMLVAMARDLRVILIKLADRLHNMRTLGHLSTAKQEEISRETLEIYAPLANRLGVSWIRTELEDLSLRYLKPQIFEKLEKDLRSFRKSKEKYIDSVSKQLRVRLREYGLQAEVSGRMKHLAGVYRKMESRGIAFDQVNDLVAFRIIVEEISECYEALGLIHAYWKPVPGRFKDYIAMPKGNLYQSLHTTVIGPQGERIEIQIRTHEMHRLAEQGVAAHWSYKEGGNASERDIEHFRWLRQLMEWQQELKDPNEFMETVKEDLFEETVYVFTPNGEVRAFPRGATPVDFAYAVHTDLGNQCVGAKVNGRIVPLRHSLESGETIEILTQKNSVPNKDWLTFVVTSKARNRIRAYIRREEREKSVALGRDMLDAELRRYGSSLHKLAKEPVLDEFVKRSGQGNIENLYASVAVGQVTPKQVVIACLPKDVVNATDGREEPEDAPGPIGRLLRKVAGGDRHAIRVGGQEDVLTTFAHCCNPLPGDEIVGFVTRGRGVTVHTADCPMLLASEEERRIPVEWDGKPAGTHMVRVRTVCVDRPGLLAKLSRAITLSGVNIAEAQIKTTQDAKAVNIFSVNVEDLNQLKKLFQRLEEIDGVISVDRVRGD